MTNFFGRHTQVYLYIPNLIGYARIASAAYAFAVAFRSPITCVVSYFLGFICDELDGRFARRFNQTSTLGAVLDMVTDRVATTGLLAILCAVYQDFHMLFLSLLMLDIFSHWFQMYATQQAGSATHKDTGSRSWIVRTYYKHRLFMGFCCVCCEVEYLALYLLSWPQFQQWALVRAPFLREVEHRLPPLFDAQPKLDGIPAVALLALLALPGVVVKQVCNVSQLRTAMQALVAHDVKRMR